MRRANVVSGILLSLIGLAALFVLIPWQIEPGPAGMMSPRLVPTIMMAVVTGLALLLVANNLRPDPDETEEAYAWPITRSEIAGLVKLGAVFALSVALFEWVSPLAAGAALVAGTLLVLGERRPLVIVLMPSALLLALWLLFYKALGTAIV